MRHKRDETHVEGQPDVPAKRGFWFFGKRGDEDRKQAEADLRENPQRDEVDAHPAQGREGVDEIQADERRVRRGEERDEGEEQGGEEV